jgi:cyclopropane fatty-acyl-phospholipid synthase-like methyltransferase
VLNWYLRYEPFLRVLDAQPGRVLDVGSGWYGLTWYAERTVVQTDLKFTGSRPSEQCRRGRAEFVCASAEKLPFADDSFDWAVSSDMVEHLPSEIRAASIKELTRVARQGVIVGFPSGRPAALVDRTLALLARLVGRRPPDWLREHLQQESYPDVDLVRAAVPAGWRVVNELRNGNVLLQFLIVLAELVPGVRTLTARFERRMAGRPVPGWFHMRPTTRVLVVLCPE